MTLKKYFSGDVTDLRGLSGNVLTYREALETMLVKHFRERAARVLKNPAVRLDNGRVYRWAGRVAAEIYRYPDIEDIDLEIDSIIENDFQMMLEREW